MTIFDSNVWIAFLYLADQQHSKAEKIFSLHQGAVVIPEYIIAEIVTVLTRKDAKSVADRFLEIVTDNKDVEILFCTDQFFMHLTNIFKTHHQHNLSFVDMMLLSLADSYHIVTFDKALQQSIIERS